MSNLFQVKRIFSLIFLALLLFAPAAFAEQPCKCWIDVKTGKRVGSFPVSEVRTDGPNGPYIPNISKGGKTAFNPVTKQNYALVPCPPPGQATSDTLKKVFDSVHIGIGIGGGYSSGHDERHHGEDRHRTAEKVSTDKTKTHKTSPTTTHKTVTSACKCHPCTCAPCTCH